MSPSPVADLVSWLRVQLDEDVRLARGIDLRNGPLGGASWYSVDDLSRSQREGGAGLNDFDAEHIVRWDPARVLREVEAKRRILDLHAPVPVNFGDETACTECARGPINGLCPTLRALALPYSDRPGYREQWAP